MLGTDPHCRIEIMFRIAFKVSRDFLSCELYTPKFYLNSPVTLSELSF